MRLAQRMPLEGMGQVGADHSLDLFAPGTKDRIGEECIDTQSPMMIAGKLVIQPQHFGAVAKDANCRLL